MTVEEQRLADWLHAQTPEPPRLIQADDIHPAPPHPRWLPLLAAAVIIVVAAIALALTQGRHSPNGRAATENPSPSASPTLDTAPTPSPSVPSARSLPVPVWGATRLGHASGYDLIGAYGSLYVATLGNSLRRLDPSTGAVLASHSLAADGPSDPVAAGGYLWAITASSRDQSTLTALDPRTLAAKSSTTLPLSSTDGAYLAADGTTLLVAAAHTAAFVDLATGHVVHRTDLPGADVRTVAFSPDGKHAYVATEPNVLIVELDPATGQIVDQHGDEIGTTITQLVITSSGKWMVRASGMQEGVEFDPDNGSPIFVGSGGGGWPESVAVIDGAAWVGGYNTLTCADPDTGQIRATATLHNKGHQPAEDIANVARVNGMTFATAVARNGFGGIVQLHPPAACTG